MLRVSTNGFFGVELGRVGVDTTFACVYNDLFKLARWVSGIPETACVRDTDDYLKWLNADGCPLKWLELRWVVQVDSLWSSWSNKSSSLSSVTYNAKNQNAYTEPYMHTRSNSSCISPSFWAHIFFSRRASSSWSSFCDTWAISWLASSWTAYNNMQDFNLLKSIHQ